MSRGVEQVACTILERLGNVLSDVVLDYESFAGVHNFIINTAARGVEFSFPIERLLIEVSRS